MDYLDAENRMDEFMRAAPAECRHPEPAPRTVRSVTAGRGRSDHPGAFSSRRPAPRTSVPLPIMRVLLACLVVILSVAVPAASQTPPARESACDRAEPGLPLVGRITDATTGQPLLGAVVIVDDYPLGMAEDDGCYLVIGGDEIMGGRRRVQVVMHRYVSADTMIEISAERSDTVHFALRPTAPGCCRLEGEWSLHLTLDTLPEGNRLEPRAREAEGRMVFSGRLPSGFPGEREDPRVENGRFDVDLSRFFGGPYAADVSTTVMGPTSRDFFTRAAAEVFEHDSVAMVLIPGMSHGGLSLEGTVSGDTVRGRWVQNAYCCGARGGFVMHRVPPSPAGDSLIARGVRHMAEEREAAEKEKAARAGRVGRLRLRVWDTGAGRYTEVRFAAEGHEDNPGGGSTSLAYESGADGWGRVHELEPGRYDLLIYEFTCNGETRMGQWVDVTERTPRFPVTIQPGRQVDKDIRLDVCAIEPDEGDEMDGVAPVAVPLPR